ncbi:MAG: hypothetical protein LUF02_06170 [Erysipelotrichaceae bacterium]|nr:hypothetical protein [Erysipelotrichaceae bacterium]
MYNDENFKDNLNGEDIPQFLYEKIYEYTGFSFDTIELNGMVEYVNAIKFYNCSIEYDNQYISAGFFQSDYYIPSVSGITAPCVFLIVYDNSDLKSDVVNLLSDIELSILYDQDE